MSLARSAACWLFVSSLCIALPADAASMLLGAGTLTRTTPNSLPLGTDELRIRLSIATGGPDEVFLFLGFVDVGDIGSVQTATFGTPGFEEARNLLRNDEQDNITLWSHTPGVGWAGNGNPEYVIFGGGPLPGERDFHGNRIDRITMEVLELVFEPRQATITIELSVYGEPRPVHEPVSLSMLVAAMGAMALRRSGWSRAGAS